MPEDRLDGPTTRAALRELIADFRNARARGTLNENVSERDIHRWVDRLLQILGWNVDDVRQYSREAYTRGAGFADAVLVNRGQPICYVEVKRLGRIPSLSLLHEERRYYSREEEQALRYARRSAQLPEGQRWTILTNFEHFYVFEATREERLMVFESPEELVGRFDDETRFLSRSEMLGGGLLRWVHRRERPDVDEQFRNRLNAWRLGLAQDIYERNKDGALRRDDGTPDVHLLQRAVQRFLDRLVVLQYATDLEAIPGEPLRELLDRTSPTTSTLLSPPSLRVELNQVFRRFDEFYNTTIFAPGHICEDVDVGDQLLREVIDEIASQNFRRFTSDILGTTYETYLGQQLEVDEAEVVRLVVRPEVRRAGGIYYTPTHVVRYIVGAVLDPLLETAEAEDVAQLTILDPACGSGSFLVAAFEKLAAWYESENLRRKTAIREYLRDNPGQAALGESIPLPEPIEDFHRSILERNLYGLDLDPDAAELAAINLVMTAIRSGMAGGTLEKLPAVLGQNIKVGNSVVPGVQVLPGHAFFTDDPPPPDLLASLVELRHQLQVENDVEVERHLMARLDSSTAPVIAPFEHRVAEDGLDPRDHQAFVWPAEFPEVFSDGARSSGGFSCVIGNPPWIGFTGARETRPYLSRRFETCSGRFDMYVPFIELSMKLLAEEGRFGMITPSNFFLRDYGERLRRFIRNEQTIEEILDFGDRQIFKGATNYPAILIMRRTAPSSESTLEYRRGDYGAEPSRYLQQNLTDQAWHFLSPEEKVVFDKMTAPPSVPLSEVCEPHGIMEGIVTGQNNVFLVDQQKAGELGLDSRIAPACPRGQFIKRWRLSSSAEYVIYPYRLDEQGRTVPWDEEELEREYPRLYEYLSWWRVIPSSEGGLSGRDYFDASRKEWWELWNQRDMRLLTRPKLVTPEVAAVPNYAFAPAEVYVPNSASALVLRSNEEDDLFFVLGLLNSKILGQYHRRTSVPKANGYLIYLNAFLHHIPIRFPQGDDSFLYDRIVRYAREATEAATEHESLNLDFNAYIQEFDAHVPARGSGVSAGSVGSWLQSGGPKNYEVLSIARGRLYSVETEVSGPWLTVVGKVRFSDNEYSAGEYDQEPLVRVRLTSERLEFLQYYLSWAHHRAPYSTGRRLTLYQKLQRQPLPRFVDEGRDVSSVLDQYRPTADRAASLRAAIQNAEVEIEVAVQHLYGLTQEDLVVLQVKDG